jgi:hypothetical protein
MKKVYIEYIGLTHQENGILGTYAENAKEKIYEICTTPDEADLILLVKLKGYGPFINVLLNKSFFKYPRKTYMFCSGDKPLYFIPGLYTSLESKFSTFNKSCHYIHGPKNKYFLEDRIDESPEFLYSFVGNIGTNIIRQKIISLDDDRALIENTYGRINKINNSTNKASDWEKYRIQYADSIFNAKFILCPRGFGTSSFRIFEAMRCGRVPVIISNDWVEPFGLNWSEFSIRIREEETDQIPNILLSNEPSFGVMGNKARKIWENYFSESYSFNILMTQIETIHLQRNYLFNRDTLKSVLKSFHPTFIKGFIKEEILKIP